MAVPKINVPGSSLRTGPKGSSLRPNPAKETPVLPASDKTNPRQINPGKANPRFSNPNPGKENPRFPNPGKGSGGQVPIRGRRFQPINQRQDNKNAALRRLMSKYRSM